MISQSTRSSFATGACPTEVGWAPAAASRATRATWICDLVVRGYEERHLPMSQQVGASISRWSSFTAILLVAGTSA